MSPISKNFSNSQNTPPRFADDGEANGHSEDESWRDYLIPEINLNGMTIAKFIEKNAQTSNYEQDTIYGFIKRMKRQQLKMDTAYMLHVVKTACQALTTEDQNNFSTNTMHQNQDNIKEPGPVEDKNSNLAETEDSDNLRNLNGKSAESLETPNLGEKEPFDVSVRDDFHNHRRSDMVTTNSKMIDDFENTSIDTDIQNATLPSKTNSTHIEASKRDKMFEQSSRVDPPQQLNGTVNRNVAHRMLDVLFDRFKTKRECLPEGTTNGHNEPAFQKKRKREIDTEMSESQKRVMIAQSSAVKENPTESSLAFSEHPGNSHVLPTQVNDQNLKSTKADSTNGTSTSAHESSAEVKTNAETLSILNQTKCVPAISGISKEVKLTTVRSKTHVPANSQSKRRSASKPEMSYGSKQTVRTLRRRDGPQLQAFVRNILIKSHPELRFTPEAMFKMEVVLRDLIYNFGDECLSLLKMTNQKIVDPHVMKYSVKLCLENMKRQADIQAEK